MFLRIYPTMTDTFRVRVTDLRRIIRNLVSDSLIREKFGEPIGRQAVTIGVPDESKLSEGGAKDMKGKSCEECHGGTYEETSLKDDWDGNLHCSKCDHKVKRWKTDESAPKGYEKVVKGIKKDKSVKNPWAVAWSMKKKGIKPKK